MRRDGRRPWLAFLPTQGESPAAWEGFWHDLYRPGLVGNNLLLLVPEGSPGLAAALQTVYPRVAQQRGWVPKRRNLLEKVRPRDYDVGKADAQALYGADGERRARQAFQRFRFPWHGLYPARVRRLEKDLPERRTCFRFPRHLGRKLRTTKVIERCFVEVRRRTRPLVCFVNVQSVDRIIDAIFNGLNENVRWKNRTLRLFTQAA